MRPGRTSDSTAWPSHPPLSRSAYLCLTELRTCHMKINNFQETGKSEKLVLPRQHASAASRAASTRGGAMFTTGANVAHVDLECACCTSCSTRCVEQLVQHAHSRVAIFVSTEANSRWQPFCGDLAIPARSSVRSPAGHTTQPPPTRARLNLSSDRYAWATAAPAGGVTYSFAQAHGVSARRGCER